jgi:hypothetical protein
MMSMPPAGRYSDPLERRSSHKRRRGEFSPLHCSNNSDADFEMVFETQSLNNNNLHNNYENNVNEKRMGSIIGGLATTTATLTTNRFYHLQM